jgi:peptide/nickel transport system permease protein
VKFEKLFEKAAKRVFSSRPLLADKIGLWARNTGKTTDLFAKTRMGKLGVVVILFFVGVAIYADLAMPYDAYGGNPSHRLDEATWAHPFGTDQQGRDVLTRTAHGTTASLTVGFVAMAISMILGTVVGLASGYWGGWKDEVIMRANDVFLSIPWLVLMIVIAAVLNARSLFAVILVIGLTGWSTTARIVRAQVLSIKTLQFVERAKAIGSSEWHIIRKHIFPNVVPLIFANAILTIAIAILSEATLSYFRLGPTDVETWGRVLEDASAAQVTTTGPYLFIIMPGLCIVFVVLGFTMVGYAMDEVINPRLRER